MRIATWNINSIRSRYQRAIAFLEREDVDVLALQEIKCKPEQFPTEPFEALGYDVVAHGINQWNGVAFVSRLPITDVATTFEGAPTFKDVLEPRALGVTIEGQRLWSLYVPNGREIDDPHYQYKLEWLAALRADLAKYRDAHPGMPLAIMGDFNVAPLDSDVWDLSFFEGKTHVTQPERDAFFAFEHDGFIDAARSRGVEGYTYWDYKAVRFQRDEGMRIDFVLGTPEFDSAVTRAAIFRDERGGDGPSDHVPVAVELDVETEFDDDLPMIF